MHKTASLQNDLHAHTILLEACDAILSYTISRTKFPEIMAKVRIYGNQEISWRVAPLSGCKSIKLTKNNCYTGITLKLWEQKWACCPNLLSKMLHFEQNNTQFSCNFYIYMLFLFIISKRLEKARNFAESMLFET